MTRNTQRTANKMLTGVSLVVALSGCTEIKTESRYGTGIKYQGLGETYQWMRNSGTDRPIDPVFRDSIERELAKREFMSLAGGRPDFLITYRVAKEVKRAELNDFFGPEYHPEGTLIIDAVDPVSSKVIWRGTAQAKITDTAPPEERTKLAERAVKLIMNKFPPKNAPKKS